MKTHWPSWGGGILLLGVAFAGGWLARGGSEKGETEPDSASDAGKTGLPALTASGARSRSSPGKGTTGDAREANRWESPEAMESAFRETFSITDDREREARFYDMLLDLDVSGLPGIVNLIGENDRRGTGSGAEWEMLWQRWGKLGGTDAFDFLRGGEANGWTREGLGGAAFHAMLGWASENPSAAAAAIEGARDLDGGLDAALVVGAASADAKFATDWILARGEELGDPRRLLGIVADKVAKAEGLDAVEAWYRKLASDGSATRQARLAADVFVEKLSSNGFPEAGAWLLRESGAANAGSGELTAAASHFALRYFHRDQNGAVEWLAGLPEGEPLVEPMMVATFGTWANQDADAAGKWLGQHQDAAGYDAAAGAFVQRIARDDLESARAWAATIKDVQVRKRTEELIERLERSRSVP